MKPITAECSEADWLEYEKWLDGELQLEELERANLELLTAESN